MSVYTPVAPEELEAWLARYAVGELVELAPIAAGIENTNYYVTTTKGRYVLTLYERLPADELPFYLNLMAHLARAGVACPDPAPDRTGALFGMLNGKPASLVSRLDGRPVLAPTSEHCAAVGDRARRAACRIDRVSGPARQPPRPGVVAPGSARGAAVRRRQSERIAGRGTQVPDGLRQGPHARGAIHGDLFCDNVLFVGDRVSGIIDFGFAATDFLAYDLAITVNDWCIVRDGAEAGALVPGLVAALVGNYDTVRPLTADERTQWPALLRAAALRFWLSRLYDLHLPRPGELVHAHDPVHFERILRDRVLRPGLVPEHPFATPAPGAQT